MASAHRRLPRRVGLPVRSGAVTQGLLFGLAAGLAYGLTNVLVAVTARRIGSVRVVAANQVISLLGLALALPATGASLPADPGWWIRAGLPGLFASIGYLTYWQGLRLGPISVVTTVGETWGAVTVVLAVILLGEQLAPLQWLAVPVATAGAVLAAVTFERGSRRPRMIGAGPLLAAVSVVGFAAATVGLQAPVRQIGLFPGMFISRVFNTALTLLVLGLVLGRSRRAGGQVVAGELVVAPDAPEPPLVAPVYAGPVADAGLARRTVLLVALVGLVDLAGILAMANGLRVADAWLVGLAASTGPAATIGAGLLFFGERLRPHQWLGVGLVAGALVLIALA